MPRGRQMRGARFGKPRKRVSRSRRRMHSRLHGGGGTGGATVHDLRPDLQGGEVVYISGDTAKSQVYVCPRGQKRVNGDCQLLEDDQIAALANGSRYKQHGNGPTLRKPKRF